MAAKKSKIIFVSVPISGLSERQIAIRRMAVAASIDSRGGAISSDWRDGGVLWCRVTVAGPMHRFQYRMTEYWGDEADDGSEDTSRVQFATTDPRTA